MTHNINLWFNEKQVKKLRKLYDELKIYVYGTLEPITKNELQKYLKKFYGLLEESINTNKDVYHGLSIEDFKKVINGFVFNLHNPTNSEYKLLFVIKNALMNTHEDRIKTQPELWEDLKNNHFHYSKDKQFYVNRYDYLYSQIHEVFKKQFEDRYTKEKYEPKIKELIKTKLSQTSNNTSNINKRLNNAGFYIDEFNEERSKSYQRLQQLLGEIWVTHYEIQYLHLIPQIQDVYEIDNSIKNQLLYAFVNVNYYCFEKLVDEFYNSINNKFLKELNHRFWRHYFNNVDVLSILGNNTHFLQKMMRRIMHLGFINPIINIEKIKE